MQEYPYNQAFILNDTVFQMYGGQTGTSSVAQRQAAYLLAEDQMTEHLFTFLKPTIITGAAWWRGNFFETEFGHIQRVLVVTGERVDSLDPLTTSPISGSALIRNAQYGYLDIDVYCNSPYNLKVVYESGLSTGTASQPAMLTALTIAAQINLNEMDFSLSNESTADIGVQKFSNQSYSEERVKLGRNAFGNSALAQRAARLVKRYRSKPAVGLR